MAPKAQLVNSADVYLSGDILIIDEVWNMSTGEVTGWNYTMHEPSVDNVVLRTTSTDKYGTFSFEDGTLTDQIYNITRVTEFHPQRDGRKYGHTPLQASSLIWLGES